MIRLLTFLIVMLLPLLSYAGASLKLSDGKAVVRYSATGRVQIEVSLLNDLGRDLILESYSKP